MNLVDDIVILMSQYTQSSKLPELQARLIPMIKRHVTTQKILDAKLIKKARTTKQMLDEIETLTARNKELYALLRQAQGENRKLRAENQTLRHEIMDLEIAKGKVEVVYE